MAPADFGRGYSKLRDADEENYDDFEYKQLVSNVVKDIQNMSSQISLINSFVQQIGTSREEPKLLDDLQRKQHYTNDLAKKIGECLKKLSSMVAPSHQDQLQRSMLLEKLKNNFADVLKKFQIIQRLAAEKEKDSIRQAKKHSISSEQAGGTLIEGLDRPELQQEQVHDEAELTLEEIERREEAVRQLEQDIIGVNDIFRDLATMINEQGTVIDSIEANVEVAAVRVDNARLQLTKAHEHQTKSRKKMGCFVLILLAIVLVIVLIIYFSVRKSPTPPPPSPAPSTSSSTSPAPSTSPNPK